MKNTRIIQLKEREYKHMSKVIIFANQKGEITKTSSAINLGIGLVREGKRVLLIDNDPQGSATMALEYTQPDELRLTLATIMERVINEEDFVLTECIVCHEEGIDLLPGNIELSGVETTLVNIMSGETVLREYVNLIRDQYDYILIDCSPNLGMLTLNAMTCADYVIIPVQAAYLPVRGLELLLKTISRVKRKMNPNIEILGVLLSMIDERTNYGKEIIDLLYQSYGNNIRIFESRIPFSVRAAETSALGKSIYTHDAKGKVACAYASLTKEVLSHEQ